MSRQEDDMQREDHSDQEYQPSDIPDEVLARFRARVLCPTEAVPAADHRPVGSTVYRVDRLQVPSVDWARDDVRAWVEGQLGEMGLTAMTPAPPRDERLAAWMRLAEESREGYGRPLSLRLVHRPDVLAQEPMDAWRTLQHLRFAARGAGGNIDEAVQRFSLEHLLWGADTTIPKPGTEGHGDSAPTAYRGTGRLPVRLLGRPPFERRQLGSAPPRRPVVAVLDTPLGAHPWLPSITNTGNYVVDQTVLTVPGTSGPPPIGPTEPLTGQLRRHVGHGEFIAGIITQIVPDATVLSIPVMHYDGAGTGEDVADGVAALLGMVIAEQQNPGTGLFVDVLVLAMGYYSEDPLAAGPNASLFGQLRSLIDRGVAVVASAGNDATARRCYPAAWALELGLAMPIVSVGALNPNGTGAIFSNQADSPAPPPDWVTRWAPGVAITSAFPAINGGYTSLLEVPALGRQAFDPDDFSAGFATWDGTSFAAAVYAAELVSRLLAGTLPVDTIDPKSAIDRMSPLL